ncbi:MAG: fibronectin type III domain-containing protein, partial [Clostridia bacterium]|nr:fibronectin type III domain-containing protein [Clostridia bacterium]
PLTAPHLTVIPELDETALVSVGFASRLIAGAVKGTIGYYVYRKTANSTWVRVATVGGTNNTTFLDKTAKKGTTYTYTVKAVYGATTSGYYSGISCYDKY